MPGFINKNEDEASVAGTQLFGSGDVAIERRVIDLSTARTLDDEIFRASDWIWVIDGTDTAASLDFHFNQQRSEYITLKKGMFIRIKFAKVYLTNSAQSGKTLTIISGRGNTFEIINAAETNNDVDVSVGGTVTTTVDNAVADAAVTQVAASAATRREIIIQNKDGAATVQVGDSAVTATRGINLGPGETIILNTTAAISVRNDSGGTVDISVTEILD